MTTTSIGTYRIVETLGKGTFGIVYQAYQPFLDRFVAVKTLHADYIPIPESEQHFMDEARTIARLRHPNIVTVYEFGTLTTDAGNQTYMVMEYLAGKTLADRTQAAPLAIPEIVAIVEQLSQALDYAHARGVIHRDLKPTNILFTDIGQPVIVDFGLAQLIQVGRAGEVNLPTESDASTLSGTPAYMAPEQFTGQKTSPATDQYALAAIVYELLSHKRLFADLTTSTRLLRRVQGAIEPLKLELPPELGTVQHVLERALASNMEDRYETAGAFARDFIEALQPDHRAKRGIIISDPREVAQIRAVRQTITGFLWGIAAIVLLVMLFSAALYLRGYTSGFSALFVWDGILARPQGDSGLQVVNGLWPGSSAEQAGVRIGDTFKTDLLNEYSDQRGDYTVNGQLRVLLPASWVPHLGDVIHRTFMRNGQPIEVSYTLDRSWHALLLLIMYSIPAALAYISAVWLLRRWGPEPGIRIIFPLLLSSGFLFLSQALAQIIPYTDTLAAHVVLPSLLLFILMYPDPLPILTRRRWLIWLIFVPLLGPALEFLVGSGIPIGHGLELQFASYIAYALAVPPTIFLKWGRRDLKHYPSLLILIIAFLLVPLTVVPSVVINALDIHTSNAIFGNDVYVRLTAYSIISIGSSLIVILTWIGYHQLQKQIGPSFIMQADPEDRSLLG